LHLLSSPVISSLFTDSPPTAIYPLSLHDALPIYDCEPYGVLGWLLAGTTVATLCNSGDRELIARALDSLPRSLAEGRGLFKEGRSEEHTSELQSLTNLVCRLLLEKKKETT